MILLLQESSAARFLWNADATDELRSARINADLLLTAYCLLLTDFESSRVRFKKSV
jgi:hypothetical protein